MNAGITAEDNRSELSAGSTVTLEITAYGSEGQGLQGITAWLYSCRAQFAEKPLKRK